MRADMEQRRSTSVVPQNATATSMTRPSPATPSPRLTKQTADVTRIAAEREPQTNFRGALRHRVREHGIDADPPREILVW